MNKITKKNDIKVNATAIIWGCSTGMMAILISHVAMSTSGLILLLVLISGTSLTTILIWHSDNQKVALPFDNYQQIEQRIRNLETIASNGNLDTDTIHKNHNVESLNYSRDQ
ncbi:MAG: hypothetical protein ACFB02_12945 [Mastigocoleus sp.]